jgi:hypothetical protein
MNKWNENRRKRTVPLQETATKSAPKPADFPIGSMQSRAAARVLLQDREKMETVIQIVYVSPDGTRKNGQILRFPIPVGKDLQADRRAADILRERMARPTDERRPDPSETRVEYMPYSG